MNKSALAIVLSVGLINVVLNILLSLSAKNGQTAIQSFFSWYFALAFFVGMLSISLIVMVYRSGINLSQGIVLMAATSIIIGTIYGYFVSKNRLSFIEYAIFFVLLVLYIFRWFKEK